MQDNPTIAEQNIKSNSNPEQVDTSHPEQSIQANAKESTSNKRAEKKSKSLGKVAWERIFNNYKSKLPHRINGSLKKGCNQ